MDTDNMIEITGSNLTLVIQKAYELSKPQGMGFFHFVEGDTLTDDEANEFIKEGKTHVVHLDYIKGRSCKFNIYHIDGRHYIPASWYDHTDEDLQQLLIEIGVIEG